MQGLARPHFLRALALLGLGEGAMEIALQAWISVVYLLCYALVYRLLLPCTPLRTVAPVQRRLLLPLIGIMLGLAVCGLLISAMLMALCGPWGIALQGLSLHTPSHPVAFVWNWVNLTLWPAWIEEAIFRVRVLGFLSSCGTRFSIVYSAALFALLHGSLLQVPSAFLLGCLFAITVYKTGSVHTTMLLHVIHNSWVYGLSLCLMHLPAQMGSRCALMLYALWLVLGYLSWRSLKQSADQCVQRTQQVSAPQKSLALHMRWPCVIALAIALLFHCLQFVL